MPRTTNIVLSFPHYGGSDQENPAHCYRVESTQHALEPAPGAILSRVEAQALVSDNAFAVTIVRREG